MSRFVDLHTHSTFSDGTLDPRRLVAEARKAGLAAIALTDHDVLDGLAEAREAGREEGVEIIAGVEISARSKHGEVHVLGLDVSGGEAPESPLQLVLARQRDARQSRAARVLEKLESLGMPLDLDEVRRISGEGSLGRPHIASAMVARGYVGSIEEAFARYLKEGGPGYAPREAVSAEEAVTLIRDAGGLASVAHPAFVRTRDHDELEAFLASLVDAGLEGLECFTSAHDEAATAACVRIARRLSLVPTGGSDFHGDRKTNVRLGRTRGGGRIPYAILDDVRERVACRRDAPARGAAVQDGA
ncbi:MAG: PHP domain-containing protein [Deltaproteobacteria bacterium]|nr:PHP domain-containing protein [Deltaproteobacteria bacterium]